MLRGSAGPALAALAALAALGAALALAAPGAAAPVPDGVPVRPGAQVGIDGGQCTLNFAFTADSTHYEAGPDGNGLYMGTAAHCVGHAVGTDVYLRSKVASTRDGVSVSVGVSEGLVGKVAYSSYAENGHTSEPCYVVLSCQGGPDGRNDFALVEVHPHVRDQVDPSVPRFGGPTGTASWADLRPRVSMGLANATGEDVVADDGLGPPVAYFGNSSLRPGPAAADHGEGYVTGRDDAWQFRFRPTNPPVPGDSGGPVLLGDGRAAGVVTAIRETGGPWLAASLDEVVGYARDQGWDLTLATADDGDRTLLPEPPDPASARAPAAAGGLPALP